MTKSYGLRWFILWFGDTKQIKNGHSIFLIHCTWHLWAKTTSYLISFNFGSEPKQSSVVPWKLLDRTVPSQQEQLTKDKHKYKYKYKYKYKDMWKLLDLTVPWRQNNSFLQMIRTSINVGHCCVKGRTGKAHIWEIYCKISKKFHILRREIQSSYGWVGGGGQRKGEGKRWIQKRKL